MSESTSAKELRNRLLYTPKNGHDRIADAEKKKMEAFSRDYRAFIDSAKTERECVREVISRAEREGFRSYTPGMAIRAGDKLYLNGYHKSILLAVIGKKPLDQGVNLIAAHIDAPRIDVRTMPLYQEGGICLMKTHYYGGIKKYQWTAMPLELVGVVSLRDGTTLRVSIGADEDDPVFCITDLLPHLAKDQMTKTLAEGIPAESLNVFAGSIPSAADQDGKDRVRLHVLELLNEKYGIVEEDFISAELTMVPAFKSRDVGCDRSMIGAYAHDDRCCSFAGLAALFEEKKPVLTTVLMLADKEEIGSEGISGMQSRFFDTFMQDLCDAQGVSLARCFERSRCISADVGAATDPNFPEVSEKRNDPKINLGPVVTKYTGARGKSGASEAPCEMIADMRRIMDEKDIVWQFGQLGKVDQGGGGTVAMYIANRNIQTLDMGVPVLSMHAPFELISKLDLYMTKRAYAAFYAWER